MSDFFSILPAGLQPIMQNGILDGVFEDSLQALYLYNMLADERPWAAEMGAQSIMTKGGLMAEQTSPVTGSDAPQSNYGFEQYNVRMEQFGNSIDTNMAVSAMTLASKFVEDNQKLGINAASSLNRIAQRALYLGTGGIGGNAVGGYGGGTTWATQTTTTSTSLTIAEGTGFAYAYTLAAATTGNTEGLNAGQSLVLAPVSGSNPLSITINGVANTVTGCAFTSGTSGPATLTLGTAVSVTNGWAVVSTQGPVQYRPNGRASANQIVAGDVATLQLFLSAVTRLRQQFVPTIGGAYTAHVSAATLEELFQDAAFQSAYRTRGDSPVYQDFALGRFLGIDWVENDLTPTVVNQGSVTVQRPIVCGADALIKAPFAEMGNLVSEMNAGATVHIEMLGGVARILRAPLDRFGQVLSSTWSWIGGYTIASDALVDGGEPNASATSALYKRAVVLEHA